MNEHDVIGQVRESFSGLRMDRPVEDVFAAGRVRRRRRRRRLAGLTAATAATAGAAAAMTLTLGAPVPARSSNAPSNPSSNPPAASPSSVRLAAFSVSSGPGRSTTLTVYNKGPRDARLDPSALRQALARRGIPALVTVGTFCLPAGGASSGPGKVVSASDQADGSAVVIDGLAIPPGTRLSIGLFPGHTRILVIKDGVPLVCRSSSDQPWAHITPTGTPIRG
jgi:hypothetical protein